MTLHGGRDKWKKCEKCKEEPQKMIKCIAKFASRRLCSLKKSGEDKSKT